MPDREAWEKFFDPEIILSTLGLDSQVTIRPKPEHCIEWATETGFCNPKQFNLKPYHYGLAFTK